VLQSLASAIIKERQPAKIDVLLTARADLSAPSKRGAARSLLEGVAANLRGPRAAADRIRQSTRGIQAPGQVRRCTDPPVRRAAQALFAWPGHQSPKRPNPPNPAPLGRRGKLIAEGKDLFPQICAGCHGLAGQGLKPMPPPLVNPSGCSARTAASS